MVKAIWLAVLFPLLAFARGERWMPPPPAPPPVETLTNEARYLEWKWRTDVTDPKTGVGQDAVRERMLALSEELKPKEPWNVVKAKCYAWLCDNVAIDVSPLDWFPAFSVWNRNTRPLAPVIQRRILEISRKCHPEVSRKVDAGNESGKWVLQKDFCHAVPEWEKIVRLGFPGMKRRLLENWQEGVDYYPAEKIVAEASLRLIGRLVAKGAAKAAEEKGRGGERAIRLQKHVEALKRLCAGAPETAYDVMQFIYLYFVMSEHLDFMQCRSLSVIDRMLWPYYRADIAAGRTTEAEFREQFRHFLWQWGSIDNYWGQPITMGGTKADGTTEYNPLSRIILGVMDECALPSPKFHLKIARNTPDEILDLALDMVRRHRSISFIGEEPVWRIMTRYGYTDAEARNFYTKGCYEFCCAEGGNGTGVGYVNLLKQVEWLLRDAADGKFAADTFEAFRDEYLRRAAVVLAECRDLTFELERHLDDVNPAALVSLATEYSVKTAKDGFSCGSSRGNNTLLQVSALGTTVDALMAVKELVYERHEMSLLDLGRLMAADWAGREDLRLRMLRSKRKWGNNDLEANALGVAVTKALAAEVNGRPNSRGGFFALCGHTARAFLYQGAATGATPDGRKKGDEFSKNLSATMGADTEGVTALVATLGALDSCDWPGDFPLDVMMLPNAVAGRKGLEIMRALLRSYWENGGVVIQFNVVDADLLRDAQAHPEKYENLQVRVCGWNVRWNDMPKVEQDAYICRAEGIAR